MFFPACAVTHAQSRKVGNMVDLSDSFVLPLLAGDESLHTAACTQKQNNSKSDNASVNLSVSREKISAAQKKDKSLITSFNSAVSLDVAKDRKVAYFTGNDLLMRKVVF